MHISRWCAFAKGNARGEEGVVPRAVTDKVAAAADLAKSRALAMDRMVAKTNQGDDGDDGSKKSLKKWTEPQREPRTIRCDQCSAGPFNEKGFAMHVSRWCKFRANASGGGTGGQFGATAPTLSGGGFGSPFRLGTPWFGGASSGGLGGTLGFGGLDFDCWVVTDVPATGEIDIQPDGVVTQQNLFDFIDGMCGATAPESNQKDFAGIESILKSHINNNNFPEKVKALVNDFNLVQYMKDTG